MNLYIFQGLDDNGIKKLQNTLQLLCRQKFKFDILKIVEKVCNVSTDDTSEERTKVFYRNEPIALFFDFLFLSTVAVRLLSREKMRFFSYFSEIMIRTEPVKYIFLFF